MKCGIFHLYYGSQENQYKTQILEINCNCGEKEIYNLVDNELLLNNLRNRTHVCKCGNHNFFEFNKGDSSTKNVPHLTVEQNDYKKLSVTRCNLSVKIVNDEIKVKPNTTYKIVIDFEKEGTIEAMNVLKNNEAIKPTKTKEQILEGLQTYSYYRNLDDERLNRMVENAYIEELEKAIKNSFNRFFNNLSMKEFINVLSIFNKKRSTFIEYLFNRNYYGGRSYNTTYENAFRVVKEKFAHVEILVNCGITDFDTAFRFIKDRSGKSPKEILDLGRYGLEILRNPNTEVSVDMLRGLNNIEKTLGYNIAKEIHELYIDERQNRYNNFFNTEKLIDLHKTYGYNNIKALCLYLIRDVKMRQGIDSHNEALNLLHDYVRMCDTLEVTAEKYPKSLKKEHDLVMLNYRALRDKSKNDLFAKVVTSKDYEDLKFKSTKFGMSVIPPKATEDLVREGEDLNHCVGSYIDRVCNKQTMVMFVRENDSIDSPYVTVEITNRRIRQAKSKSNQKPNKKTMDFIKYWAEKKELELAVY